MHKTPRFLALVAGLGVVLAACSSGGGASSAPADVSAAPPVEASAEASDAAASVDPNSLLGMVMSTGKIRVSTDPNYKPFSFLNPDGTYEGFDNATAEEAVKRLSEKLGQEIAIQWETPGWDLITAGSWGGRWDISIGSMMSWAMCSYKFSFTARSLARPDTFPSRTCSMPLPTNWSDGTRTYSETGHLTRHPRMPTKWWPMGRHQADGTAACGRQDSVLDGVPQTLPALLRAYQIQARASRVGFDWTHDATGFDQVLGKIEEEIRELRSRFGPPDLPRQNPTARPRQPRQAQIVSGVRRCAIFSRQSRLDSSK